jgi:spore coat protein H
MFYLNAMKTLWIFHFVFLTTAATLSGQGVEDFILTKPVQISPTNTISFTLPASKLNQLHQSKGEKLSFDVPLVIVNGDSIKTKHIRIRGNTSSYLRRKSLNIKLSKKASFYRPRDTFSLKKFYIISMSMDRNYIRNRISCEVLHHLNVNVPFNAYANLLINDKTEGLYLAFYPPEEFGLEKCDASLVIRRGYDASIDGFQYENISKKEAAALNQKFQSIYKDIIHKNKGEQLYNQLEVVLDLEGYFAWLAFNDLFQNGDYADEVYVMWNKTKTKFEVIPWDFDDILHSQPHEGLEKRNAVLHDKLLFSSEDALDVKIADDDFLYMKYLQTYKRVLDKLSPSVLSGIFNGVFQEVYPFYQQPDIIGQSQYDTSGLTDMEKLENDMRNIYQTINAKAVNLRLQINSLLEGYESTAK